MFSFQFRRSISITAQSLVANHSREYLWTLFWIFSLYLVQYIYNPVLYGSDIKSRLKIAIDFTKKCSGHEFCVRRRTGRDVRTERILWNDWSMTLNTRPQVNFPNASTLYSILDDRPRGKTLVWGDVMRRREREKSPGYLIYVMLLCVAGNNFAPCCTQAKGRDRLYSLSSIPFWLSVHL